MKKVEWLFIELYTKAHIVLFKKYLFTTKTPNMSSNISLFLNDESSYKYYAQWLSFKWQKPQQVLKKISAEIHLSLKRKN